MYERHLPHWRQEGATYFVTFRLHDSLPQSKLRELDALKQEWAKQYPLPRSTATLEKLARAAAQRIERWLDQGMGSCVLKQAALARLLVSALHYFDGERYELDCYVVMPNHVHVVVRPTSSQSHALEDIVGGWKSYSARQINNRLRRVGDLWQQESYDRIIRDEEHLWQVIRYIGDNPGKAGLPSEICPMWIRPEWVAIGWDFPTAEVGGPVTTTEGSA
jgi:REP element-mobilizing transposase RayT